MQTVSRIDIERELRSRFALYEPYPKQKEFHNATAAGKLVSGGNQRIPLKSAVLTPNGWKKSGDLKIGDEVYTHRGAVTHIEAMTPVKESPLYEIKFNDGTSALCSDDHLWLLINSKGKEVVKDTKFMVMHWHSSMYRIPISEPIPFAEKQLSVPPYLMGLYLGNGWLKPDGGLMLSDSYDKYEELKQYFDLGTYYPKTQSFKVHNAARYNSYLKTLGKATEKYIPEIYLRASIDQRKELLAGLIDTDGHIDTIGRVAYYTASKELATGVCDLMRGLGCKVRLSERIQVLKGKPYKGYTVRGRCPFKPNKLRSKNEWQPSDKIDYKTKCISSIKLIGRERQRCYRVANEDHTFIIDDYVVTHNCGKTIAGCHEVAFQATGIYPDWFRGWRMPARTDVTSGKKLCNIIVAATDSKTLRDSIMSKIIGTEINNYADGLISPQYVIPNSMVKSRGVSGGLLDSIQVRRQDGSICTIFFRSYEQGRENLQSITADYVYCDEEPPQDVYSELMARLVATGGHFAMAFTPLKGMTPLVQEYWNHENPDKVLFCMSIYEVAHIANDPEKIRQIKNSFSGLSEAEREARMLGIPAMGSGMVYPINDDVLKYDGFIIPNNWKRIAAIDFGRGEHPIACVWLAFSPEDDCYLYDCFKLTKVGDAEIASQILSRGNWIPVAYPHDFMKNSGVSTIGDETKTEGWLYKEIFAKYGINFTPHNARTEQDSVRVEAGIIEVRQAMIEGKFHVARHLNEWFKEKATYLYKDDGSPTKEKDDLLDATRYAYIMRRYAESKNEADGVYPVGYSDKAVDNTLGED